MRTLISISVLFGIVILPVGCSKATDSEGEVDSMSKADTKQKARFWKVKSSEPWGGYGEVLISGDAVSDTKSGCARVFRAGSFMPPVTFPSNHCIVNQTGRAALEAKWPTIRYCKAVKEKVTDVKWHLWDPTADSPPMYPPAVDSFSYISELPHSAATADELGDLFEAIVPNGAESFIRNKRHVWEYDIVIKGSSWNGSDFFTIKPKGYEHFIVTDAGKEMLVEISGKWLTFTEMLTE
jgi:hypothetical protein